MEKTKAFIKKWSRRKRSYVILVLAVLIIFLIAKPKTNSQIVTDVVKEGDIKATVLATGTVTSKTDLELSFNSSGVARSVRVEVGDEVKAGAVLATLDQGSAYAALTSARGGLAAAQARYKKVLEGATSEEVTLAQVALTNAQTDLKNTKDREDNLVANDRRTLLSSGLAALSSGNSAATAPTISGTYTSSEEGRYTISPYNTGSGGYFSISGLESGTGQINTATPVALGTRGLFIQFPSGFSSNGTTWTVTIPNTQGSTYVTNLNAYQSALNTRDSAISSAQSLVDQRTAELNIKKAQARPSDIDLAEADVLSAQGALQSAQAGYENVLVRAPADGTITSVDIKLGELAQAQKEVIILQDIKNLYLEASVNESDVAELVLGQIVTFTTDAFGPDKVFTGVLSHIDPAPTTNGSVVNYKIKATIDPDQDTIKTGMTANLSVLIEEKKDILYIPDRFVEDRDGKKFVSIITDVRRQKTEEREVVLGVRGDGGLIEIISGLKAGDGVLLKLKQ